MTKKKKSVLILITAWIIFTLTDLSLAYINRPPFFARCINSYDDGGSVECYGPGYKVIKYVNLSPYEGLEIVRVDFGSWKMKFSK